MTSCNCATAFRPWIPEHSRLAQQRDTLAAIVPRPFGHGYLDDYSDLDSIVQAAIVPRPFGHGYGLTDVEWPHRSSRCNCATAFRPWILRGAGSGPREEDGCNCATAFRPWIQDAISTTMFDIRLAAIVPRPFGHGYYCCGYLHAVKVNGCNCATAFRPWILVRFCNNGRKVTLAAIVPRPFGHGYYPANGH